MGVGAVGEDNTDLTPRYGLGLRYAYMMTDQLELGGILELRSFEPDPVAPLSAKLPTARHSPARVSVRKIRMILVRSRFACCPLVPVKTPR